MLLRIGKSLRTPRQANAAFNLRAWQKHQGLCRKDNKSPGLKIFAQRQQLHNKTTLLTSPTLPIWPSYPEVEPLVLQMRMPSMRRWRPCFSHRTWSIDDNLLNPNTSKTVSNSRWPPTPTPRGWCGMAGHKTDQQQDEINWAAENACWGWLFFNGCSG